MSKHIEMRSRLLGWTISYKSLYFVHPSLELVPQVCALPAKFNTVNPLLSPLGGLFISSPFEGGGGGRGRGLINSEKTMVSVLPEELEYKVEKLKYKKVGGTSSW